MAWIGCFWLCRELAARRRIDPDWRLSWVLACGAWGGLLTLVVELSSLGRRLTGQTLFASWSGLALGLLGAAGWLATRRGMTPRLAAAQVRRRILELRNPGRVCDSLLLWGFTAAVIVLLGWIALDFPTTTGDSLTYHLARIMHWIQEQSVAYYPTHNCRQNELGPWAEYVTTNLHLLWGSDRLVNLVQWFAMLGSVVVTTWIAEQLLSFRGSGPEEPFVNSEIRNPNSEVHAGLPPLAPGGLKRRAAALTALLIVTLPIGIVEAVTTQNDYVTAFWLACVFSLALALAREPRNVWYAWGAGLAFSLGVLTKATMIIYAGPLLAALACWLWPRAPRLRLALVFAIAFVALNAGHMRRNYALVGSPLAGPYIHHLVSNQNLSASGTLSNLIRNLALASTTPFPAVNRLVNYFLAGLHGLSGRGLNDPAITYEQCLFNWPEKLQIYDSQASNPLHLLLILIALLVALARFREDRPLLAYAGLLGASFALFCALLRWQEWHSRMHLPYLVVLMPCVAAVFLTRMPPGVVVVTVLLAAAQGVFVFFKNESRPLLDPTFTQIPREEQYMAIHMPDVTDSYLRACQAIANSGCTQVGLKLQYGDFEYPLWVMLQNRGFEGRLDHAYVEDVSARLPGAAPQPCVVLTTLDPPPAAVTNDFPVLMRFGQVTLCWPAPGETTKPHGQVDDQTPKVASRTAPGGK
jgi:hypothetical protein